MERESEGSHWPDPDRGDRRGAPRSSRSGCVDRRPGGSGAAAFPRSSPTRSSRGCCGSTAKFDALRSPRRRDQGNSPSFGALAMGRDGALAQAYFEAAPRRGHSIEWLCTHLLAPTARHLGGLWEQDLCDFVDVTLGMARLQEILARFGSPAETRVVDERHCALLISMPGEKHLLGLEIVAESLRGAGWRVQVERGFDAVRSAAAVAAEWVGVVGVTLSGETGLETAARIIESVRRASVNPGVGILVGGPAFAQSPPQGRSGRRRRGRR